MKAQIDLTRSVNTSTIDQDIKVLGQPEDLLQNNGIHNDGGITNIYLETEAFASGEHFTADTGEDIQTLINGGNLDVSVGGVQVGSVSPYGVKHRRLFKGYDDVMIVDNVTIPDTYSIMTCQLKGNSVEVKVFTEDGAEIPAQGRTIAFTKIAAIGTNYQSLNFVRQPNRAISGALKFVLRSGTKAILLDEAAPTAGEQDFRAALYGMDNITFQAAITIPGKYTAIISSRGRLSSVDVNGKWKFWDGSGDGSGPFYNMLNSVGATSGSFRLSAGSSFGELLVVYAISGPIYKLMSYDGSQWKNPDGTGAGTGIYSADAPGYSIKLFTYTYAGASREALFIGGASGRLSSYDYLRRLKRYDGLGDGAAYYSAGAFVGTHSIFSLEVWNNFLIVWSQGAGGGRLGSLDSAGVAKSYDGTGSGSGPYDNNVALAEYVYSVSTGPAGEMVLGGTTGRVASYDGTNWKTYLGGGSGTGIYGNGTGVTGQIAGASIQTINGEQVFICMSQGSIGSYSPGTGWKKSDGTGTGSGPYQALGYSTITNSRMSILLPSPDGTKTLFIGGGQIGQINIDGTIKTAVNGINLNVSDGGSIGCRTCIYEYNGKKYLVWGSIQVTSYCFDTGLYKFPNGTGGGDGPYSANNNIFGGGVETIACIVQYNNFLCFLSETGRVCSWNGTAWTNYDGSGAAGGIYSNTLNIVTDQYNQMCVYKTFLVIGGTSGRVQSFDGTAWKRYDGTGTGTGPYTNGGVTTNYRICSVYWYKAEGIDYLVCGADSALLGNWNGSAWKTYTGSGGTGPWSNGTATGGGGNITAQTQFGRFLAVGSVQGRIATWDQTAQAWKNYDGTGSGAGISNNSTVVSGAITCLLNYDCSLIAKTSATMGSITASGVVSAYNSGTGYSQPDESNAGLYIYEFNGMIYSPEYYGSFLYGKNAEHNIFNFDPENNILTLPYNDRGQLFAYYWPNEGAYLFGVPGNKSNLFNMYANGACYPVRAKYAVPTEYAGTSKAEIFLTFDSLMYEKKFRITGKIGDIGGGTFTPVIQYPAYSLNPPVEYLENECGPGYSQGNFKIIEDTSIYTAYGPTDQGAEYAEVKTNTNALIGNRGKIGSFYSIPLNGYLGGLSYAVADDQLGVSLTALGEIVSSYIPNTMAPRMIIYLSTEGHIFIQIATDISVRVEKIGVNLYKLNTVSQYNIINVAERKLYLGSTDYNGRLLVTDNAAITAITKRIVGQFSGRYSNGYDAGEDLAGVTALTPDKITAPGAKITGAGYIQEQFAVNVFIDAEYSFSIDENGAAEIIPEVDGTVYIDDTREPIPIAATYKDGAVTIAGKTFLLAGDNYDGAQSGSALAGEYGYFNLFGQDYIYDERYIYLLNLDDQGLISSYPQAAPIDGLSFVAISPTVAVFYSAFDGGVYSFDGGRVVQKIDKLNRLGALIQGAYSLHEAALYLETDDKFVIFRENIKTIQEKTADMTGLSLYPTVEGLYFGNNENRWKYNYKAVGTFQPLTVQSGYMGIPSELVKVSEIVAQISNAARTPTEITFTVESYDEMKAKTQTKTLTIGTNGWDKNGMAYARIRPENPRAVALSVKLEIDQKIILVALWYEYEPAEKANAGKRSV